MSSPKKESTLPLDILPTEWQQKERLDVLYGPVRNRNVNSHDWDSKVNFWKESISVYLSHNQTYTFTLSSLERAFLHERRTPACLKDILEELIQKKDVIPYSDFVEKPEATWSGWAKSTLVKKPAMWGFNKLKGYVVTTGIENVEFVHVKLVAEEGKKLMERIPDALQNKAVELKDFAKEMQFNKVESLQILLKYLEKDGKVTIRESTSPDGKQLVLLRFSAVPSTLEDIDVHIYVLSKQEKDMHQKIANLESKIQELHSEAKNHCVNGHKHLARSVLAKKKLTMKSVTALEKNAFNLSSLLQNLEDTAQNHNVMSTFKTANANLKAHLATMKIDDVDDTMAQLVDLIDTNNDIQATLGQGVDKELDVDAELEQELADLMNDMNMSSGNGGASPPAKEAATDEQKEDKKEETSQIGIELPSVPNSPPRVEVPLTE